MLSSTQVVQLEIHEQPSHFVCCSTADRTKVFTLKQTVGILSSFTACPHFSCPFGDSCGRLHLHSLPCFANGGGQQGNLTEAKMILWNQNDSIILRKPALACRSPAASTARQPTGQREGKNAIQMVCPFHMLSKHLEELFQSYHTRNEMFQFLSIVIYYF